MRANLLGIATAVPPHEMRTADVVAEASSIFSGRHADFERLKPVFQTSGIDRRYAARPYGWFHAAQGWPQRMEAFVETACDLFRAAAIEALAQADVEPAEVGTIVTVSSTGIATPTIESRVLRELGFSAMTKRVPVFGLGCAGGVSGLSLAARLAEAEPSAPVLLVVIELCTLSFRNDDLSKSNLVATALFGDGAAACVLSAERDGLGRVEHSGEHTWPDTLDIMGWRVDPEGFGVIFSRSIPDVVREKLGGAAGNFLAANGKSFSDIDLYCFHPGGAKVILALEKCFHLRQGLLANEREVLRLFGNMSAPTVLFVLARGLSEGRTGRRLISALGPGFTASFATMLH